MRKSVLPFAIMLTLAMLVVSNPSYCPADSGPPPAPPLSASSDAASSAAQSNTIKAHALVDAAINMTNSDQAVRLLWQATDVDPTLEEPYVYLALYYNSRSHTRRSDWTRAGLTCPHPRPMTRHPHRPLRPHGSAERRPRTEPGSCPGVGLVDLDNNSRMSRACPGSKMTSTTSACPGLLPAAGLLFSLPRDQRGWRCPTSC